MAKSVTAAVQAVSQNNARAAADGDHHEAGDPAHRRFHGRHLAERLVADEPNRIPTYSIEVDILEKLKRIYYFSKRMAKTVLPVELEVEAA